MRRHLALAAVAAAVLGLLFVVPAIALTSQTLPGTTVDGVDVGGRSREDARAVIEQVVASRQAQRIEVTAGAHTITYTPGAAAVIGDVEATLDAVMNAGRTNVLASSWNSLAATLGRDRDISLSVVVDEEAVRTEVDRIAAVADLPADPGGITADPQTLQVSSHGPATGTVVDRDAALALLVAQVGVPSPAPVSFPLVEDIPPTTSEDVADLVARATRALEEPFSLNASGSTVELAPAAIARMLTSTVDGDGLRLQVSEDALLEELGDQRALLEVEPIDATFEPVADIPVFDTQGDVTWTPEPAELRLVPSTSGRRIDVARTMADLVGALESEQRALTVPLTTEEADLTTAEAEQLGVTELIGTFTTYHACCANRVRNIQRMADLVRGVVLRPGEELSINEHVGRRTIENGFVADGAIFNGEIRQEIGGGVSQFATTTYNAAFFAGIEIVEHRAHSLYISRYPRGREATLNYPSIDLRLRNDTEHGIYVHTSYTPTSITVSLFGDNGRREVSAVMGDPYSFRGFETRRRPDPTLPAGTERVSQSGTQGYLVTVTRIITQGGQERTEEIVTTYQPRPAIILVGEGPPAPDPTPDPDTEPTPDPDTEPTPDPDTDTDTEPTEPEPTPTATPSG